MLTRPPVAATPLVGRERELNAAVGYLHRTDVRLLTLIGPAGVGKTRLGLAVAERMHDPAIIESVFVDLTSLIDPASVLAKVADAVGVPHVGDQSVIDQLSLALQGRSLLLLIDNCEHVLPAALDIAHLLAACPRVKVLATSRAPLRVSGEQEFVVAPLDDISATTLFLDRVQRIRPDLIFEQPDQDTGRLICLKLDRLPLAIELAAVRCRVIPPREMLGLLEQPLALLTGGNRDLPSRQSTMYRAIEWSYDLLDAPEQRLFRRLGAFVGTFGLQDAEAVSGCEGRDVLRCLERLVEWNLVARDGMRFRMLVTIRDFAVRQLELHGEVNDARERHALRCAELAERLAAEIPSPRERDWRAQLNGFEDDLSVALGWCVSTRRDHLGLRIAAALGDYWLATGRLEDGRQWLEQLLSQTKSHADLIHAKALCALGMLTAWLDDLDFAETALDEALTLARQMANRWTIAQALSGLSLVATRRHVDSEALRYAEESLAIRREFGPHSTALAAGLCNAGRDAASLGEVDRSQRFYAESLSISQQTGDIFQEAEVLSFMARDALRRHELESARSLARKSLALSRLHGGRIQIAWALLLLGASERADGNPDAATMAYRESLELCVAMGSRLWTAVALAGLGGIAADFGQFARAARLLGAAEALRAAVGVYPQVWDGPVYQADLRSVLRVLGKRAAAAIQDGAEAPLAMMVQLGRESASNAGSRGSSRLTARQLEVAHLVAEGLSNREIADRLHTSVRTAGNHVEHILSRLGLRTRAQIAAWMVREGQRA